MALMEVTTTVIYYFAYVAGRKHLQSMCASRNHVPAARAERRRRSWNGEVLHSFDRAAAECF